MRLHDHSASAMLLFCLLLVWSQLIYAGYAQPSPDRTPITIPRGCTNRCYRTFSRAFHDCRYRRRPVAGCELTRCSIPGRAVPGWICGSVSTPSSPPSSPPSPSASSPPSPSPSPSASPDRTPISIPRGCRNRCYRVRSKAFHDCRYRSRPVAGCSIAPCPVRRSRTGRMGWACAPTPTPSTAPDSFASLTYRAGVRYKDSRLEAAEDDSGIVYNMTYDGELAKNGVVSLDAISDFATVSCDTDGSVRVQLSSDAPAGASIASMYPLGAVLVVSRSLYGDCNIAEPLSVDDVDESFNFTQSSLKNQAELLDTFLLISSVIGSPYDVVIKGVPSAFFALFESIQFSILPVGVTASRQSSTALSLPETERAANVEFNPPELAFGPFKVKINVNVAFTGQLIGFKGGWDKSSVNVEFSYVNEYTITASLDATLEAGTQFNVYKNTDLSQEVPGLAVPGLKFLNKVETDKFELPEMKIGLYVEMPIFVELSVKAEKKIGKLALFTHKTPRTLLTLFIRGNFPFPSIGATDTVLEPRSNKWEFIPDITLKNPFELSITVFPYIRPQVALYVTILFARVSVDIGVEIEGKWAPGKNSAFAPYDGNEPTVGRCDECYDIQITGRRRIRNFGLFAGISVKFKVWFIDFTKKPRQYTPVKITLPGNPSLTQEIATGCFIEPIGEMGAPLNFLEETGQCDECPPEKPRYNPTRKECEEECTDPDKPFFNLATEECEACPAEAPTYNYDLEVCEADCPGGTQAGNNVPFYGSFKLGASEGKFNFFWEHYSVRDRAEVIYEGRTIYDTGCTGGSTTVSLSYAGTATNVIVKITPNCAGTSGTAWNFRVSCPTSL